VTFVDTVEELTDLHEIMAAHCPFGPIGRGHGAGFERPHREMNLQSERLEDRASKRRQIAKGTMIETDFKGGGARLYDLHAAWQPGTGLAASPRHCQADTPV
jgi:hypothetical protein